MASRGTEYGGADAAGDAAPAEKAPERGAPDDTPSPHSSPAAPSPGTSADASAGTPATGPGPVQAGDRALDPKVAAAVAAAEAAGPQSGQTVRVDSWIWSVRLVKTRSMGASACRGGHVRVNGERVKPAHAVRIGDEVRLRQEGRERVVVVTRLIRKRVGAPVAVQCYVDNSPPPPPREAVAPAGIRDRGAGRPTKRDRRELERLRGLPGFGGAAPGSGFGSGPGQGPGPGPSRGRGKPKP
ncbi:RNA-binding S4 domain-containing protein [Streptomyces djakartensis]|uniref:RNA-binding S4 domain-containing protein n=1 Tax=Streptomyces djakartensis TaxID=68193 RepID=UPI0034DFBB8C